ncbi:DUF3667 domain-containing protein [Pelomonas sp. UHG3]|uniref:DUF3667 domain-containing protein n=1 Tax=Roseateles hydrophilus TaxID=2975054 RepID=A0ACC6C6J0_9BURK|nr:DUF3667 domain-containing protein [Pelomonas sp. UHG3]MCY4744036.1 DUF3667 domain-containing protein [Pelomonas sp. UHG3]
MSHSAPHAPELPYCRNCHYTLAVPRPVYCGHCGQETDLHPPSVREMLTEYLGHYVALDGPLWRTLWALICLPGLLTNAYFHGARRRYVLPLRVYLSASFVFFVGWALLPQGPTQFIEAGPSTQAETVVPATTKDRNEAPASGASAPRRNTQIGDCDPARPQSCNAVERWVDGAMHKAAQMTLEQWKARARALAPYAMLAMQPVFAALLLLTFAGSGRRYAEHFVFSLHSHSLWFLALLLAIAASLEGSLLMAVFAHGLVALRRVYGLGWWGALWRGLVLSCLYFVLLAMVATAFALLIAATA